MKIANTQTRNCTSSNNANDIPRDMYFNNNNKEMLKTDVSILFMTVVWEKHQPILQTRKQRKGEDNVSKVTSI